MTWLMLYQCCDEQHLCCECCLPGSSCCDVGCCWRSLLVQLEQLSAEKAKLHKEKVDLENQLEAEQVWSSCSAAAAANTWISACHVPEQLSADSLAVSLALHLPAAIRRQSSTAR